MNLPNYLRKKRGLLQIRKDGGWDVWNPYHSKLSAYLVAGGKNWPFKKNSKILYLGSAEGNTISYLSEICKTNSITAVEISPVAMAELLVLAKKKDNIIPCLCDAHFPEKYRTHMYNLHHEVFLKELLPKKSYVTKSVVISYFNSLHPAKQMFVLNYDVRKNYIAKEKFDNSKPLEQSTPVIDESQ